tara:strand:+ start:2 stop:1753 length:1752 start_codon:yes stop_codon:yes gene_type:complete
MILLKIAKLQIIFKKKLKKVKEAQLAAKKAEADRRKAERAAENRKKMIAERKKMIAERKKQYKERVAQKKAEADRREAERVAEFKKKWEANEKNYGVLANLIIAITMTQNKKYDGTLSLNELENYEKNLKNFTRFESYPYEYIETKKNNLQKKSKYILVTEINKIMKRKGCNKTKKKIEEIEDKGDPIDTMNEALDGSVLIKDLLKKNQLDELKHINDIVGGIKYINKIKSYNEIKLQHIKQYLSKMNDKKFYYEGVINHNNISFLMNKLKEKAQEKAQEKTNKKLTRIDIINILAEMYNTTENAEGKVEKRTKSNNMPTINQKIRDRLKNIKVEVKAAKEAEEKAAREAEEKAAREDKEKAAREDKEKAAREAEEKAAREAEEARLAAEKKAEDDYGELADNIITMIDSDGMSHNTKPDKKLSLIELKNYEGADKTILHKFNGLENLKKSKNIVEEEIQRILKRTLWFKTKLKIQQIEFINNKVNDTLKEAIVDNKLILPLITGKQIKEIKEYIKRVINSGRVITLPDIKEYLLKINKDRNHDGTKINYDNISFLLNTLKEKALEKNLTRKDIINILAEMYD